MASWTSPSSGGPVAFYTVTASPGGATCTTSTLTCRLGVTAGRAYAIAVTPTGLTGLVGSSATATSTVVSAPGVGASAPTGGPTLTTTDATTLHPSDVLTVGGAGYLPGSTVTLAVHSVPVVLRSVTADSVGNLTATVTVPSTTTPGAHTLVAYGISPGGTPLTRSLALTVELRPPGTPGSVTATAGPSQVVVGWTAPSTGGPVDHYTVTSSTGRRCTTTGLSCRVGGEAGHAYALTVIATGPTGLLGGAVTVTSGTVPGPTIDAVPPAGGPALTTTDSVGALAPGDPVHISGTGYLPGSTITVAVYSTATTLDDHTASSSGTLSTTVRVPAALPAGAHTLVAYGVDPTGAPLARSLAIIIVTAPSPGPPSIAVPSRTAGPTTRALANTGPGPIGSLTVVGTALLAAGGVALGISRRRMGGRHPRP